MPHATDTGNAISLPDPRRRWLQFSLRSLLILMTIACFAVAGKLQFDWYRQRELLALWVKPLVEQAHRPVTFERGIVELPRVPQAPPGVQPATETKLLKIGVLELETSVERHAALRILVETRGAASLPILRELTRQCRHADVLTTLLHLIALAMNPDDLRLIEAFLDNPSPAVRAAAAESIGYIYQPAYGFAYGFQLNGRRICLNTVPPISATELASPSGRREYVAGSDLEESEQARQSQVPTRLRSKIETQMLRGPTPEERIAAARALVPWPPGDFQLRLAEWGVWIDDGEKLQLTEDILAEIPPFVHGAGNSLGTLARNRFDGIIAITKPIIHLTADRPLAVDLEVAIASGRPWFAFPRPDGFIVRTNNFPSGGLPHLTASQLKVLEPAHLPALEPVSEGYPWVHPALRSEGASMAQYGPRDSITAVGLRWQSLIVSPSREPWMTLPSVPDSSQFRWWQSLRAVPSSWISSYGESERFLYYDGPTLAKSPHAVVWEPSQLTITPQDMFRGLHKDARNERASRGSRDCLFIDTADNQSRAIHFRVPGEDLFEVVDLTNQTWLSGDEVERSLRGLLHERGLTDAEAEGLLVSWRSRFFQSPGRRLLTLLSTADYDRLCPIQVRPQPTEKVRVGIILAEL